MEQIAKKLTSAQSQGITAYAAGTYESSHAPVSFIPKRILRVLAALALLAATISPVSAGTQWLPFIATAYSVHGLTASQTTTKEGRTVAADPSVLPIGTVVEVSNAGPYSGQYVVQDTGSKIVGRKIDIFMNHRKDAINFGKRHISLRVLRKAPPNPKEQRKAAAEVAIAPHPYGGTLRASAR
jgi:3D (Asp-Asp-Asp) domain-containing protein